MTIHSTQPNPNSEAEKNSQATETIPLTGDAVTRHSDEIPSGTEGHLATEASDHDNTTSPDPMSATDRYRLVTPYRLRL